MSAKIQAMLLRKAAKDAEAAKKKADLTTGRDVVDLSSIKMEKVIDQETAAVVGGLPHEVVTRLRWADYPKGSALTAAHLEALNCQEAYGLIGKLWGPVKKAVNSMVGSFKPLKTIDLNRMYAGHYEVNDDGDYVLKANPPVMSQTEVDDVEIDMARTFMTSTQLTTITGGTGEGEEKETNSQTKLRPGNSLRLPFEEKWGALAQNLIVQDNEENFIGFLWEVLAAYYKKNGSNATGYSHLYWAYRVATLKATITEPDVMVPWLYFWDEFTAVPWGRESIVGITQNSVWYEATPVPPAHISATQIRDWGIKSVVGGFPKKLPSVAVKCAFYGSAMQAPDPKMGSTVHFIPTADYHKQKADCYWAPPDQKMSKLLVNCIVIPVSSVAQTMATVDAFCNGDETYRLAVTYGPSPLLWIQKGKYLYDGAVTRALARKAAVSVMWMGIYNWSSSRNRTPDIWKLAMDEEGVVAAHRTDTLLTYCYVPYQVGLQQFSSGSEVKVPELKNKAERGVLYRPPPMKNTEMTEAGSEPTRTPEGPVAYSTPDEDDRMMSVSKKRAVLAKPGVPKSIKKP